MDPHLLFYGNDYFIRMLNYFRKFLYFILMRAYTTYIVDD